MNLISKTRLDCIFKCKYDIYSMKQIIFLIPDSLGLRNVGVLLFDIIL